ncbi:hypothetical protein BHM03_00026546 [Ensete ventricosum]|nr:hypothetical protein BHM03_00026546 [Ensete ventricosum]
MRSTTTIAGARRKKWREEEGCEQDLLFVSKKQRDPGSSQDLEQLQAPCLRECLQGYVHYEKLSGGYNFTEKGQMMLGDRC